MFITLLIFKPSCPILIIYTIFTGGFNAHSQFWWPDGDSTPESREIKHLLTSLGLSQAISEPTNFEPYKNPFCNDFVITDRPNIILYSGTRASLDPYCHHQICKVNFRIPPPTKLGITAAIKKIMNSFPWFQHLNLNTDVN